MAQHEEKKKDGAHINMSESRLLFIQITDFIKNVDRRPLDSSSLGVFSNTKMMRLLFEHIDSVVKLNVSLHVQTLVPDKTPPSGCILFPAVSECYRLHVTHKLSQASCDQCVSPPDICAVPEVLETSFVP